MGQSQQAESSALSRDEPTPHEKLALAAQRLKERYSGRPGFGPFGEQSEAEYWDNLAASRFNAWRLPPMSGD